MLRRDPQAAGAAKDVAELLAREANRGRVDDGEELLEMIEKHSIEEVFIPVVKRRQTDVLFDGRVFSTNVPDDALELFVERRDSVRHQTLETQALTLLLGKRGPLRVKRVTQEGRAPVGNTKCVRTVRPFFQQEALHALPLLWFSGAQCTRAKRACGRSFSFVAPAMI